MAFSVEPGIYLPGRVRRPPRGHRGGDRGRGGAPQRRLADLHSPPDRRRRAVSLSRRRASRKAMDRSVEQLAVDTIRALCRCRAAGQLGAPRHAHGHGRPRGGAVDAVPEGGPGRPHLARPGPLRPLQRPRVDAALQPAPPGRLPAVPGRPEELPPVGVAHPRPPRAPPRLGHRDHHRPPGPGPGHRGGPGRGRGPPARRLRARPGGPPHLRLRRRRLPDGGHLLRGGLAGRAPGAWAGSSSCTTTTASPSRARPSLAFTEDVAARFAAFGWQTLAVDGHDRAAVAGGAPPLWPTSRRPSLIACRTHIAYGAPTKQDSADVHGSPAGRGGDRRGQAGHGLAGGAPLRGGPGGLRLLPRGRGPGPRRGRPGRSGATAASPPTRRPPPAGSSTSPRGRAGSRAGRASRWAIHRHPRGLRQGHQRPGAAAARPRRRFGRPGPLQQHPDRRFARLPGGHPGGAQLPLRGAGVRHGGRW